MSAPPTVAAPGSGSPTQAEKLTIVLSALAALLLAALDQTIVAPALPTIGGVLGHPEWLSWVVSAYFLAATAVTPLYGKLADLEGRRPTLYAAIAIFSLGSVISALAPNMAVLILGRAVQGLGGGGLVSLVQTIIGDVVPPIERAKYMVWISLTWAIASITGPLLGGVFTEHLHWSMIFWINLPIAAIATLTIRRAMHRLPETRRPARLDLAGSALIVVASSSLMLALTLGSGGRPWGSPGVLGLFAAAAVGFGWFFLHIARTEEALIPLSVLRDRVIAVATFTLFFVMAGNIGLSVYAPLYFESVHGLAPAAAGMGLLALSVGTVAGANVAGRWMVRIAHYRRLALAGAATAIVAMALLAGFADRLPFWGAEILIAAIGAGTGSLFPICTVAVQNAVERRDLGVAMSTLAFLRSLGSVVAVAVLGAVLLASMPAAGSADVAAPALPFRNLFATAIVGLVVGFALLLFLEERPLRDRSEERPR